MRAEVIADSINPSGTRLTTMFLIFPRIVHAEFTRHRCFSFSVGSTRAIPSKKLRQRCIDDPAQIQHWGKTQPGMVAEKELEGAELDRAKGLWEEGRGMAIDLSARFEEVGLAKQLANRCLETYQNVYQLTTATMQGWESMFAQRCHPAAQPEFKAIATLARLKIRASKPRKLTAGEWHFPYIEDEDRGWAEAMFQGLGFSDPDPLLAQLSAARCARTSYLNQDGERNPEKDLATFAKLVAANPRHLSPLEHQAQAMAPQTWLDRAALRVCGILLGRGGDQRWGDYRRERFRHHAAGFLDGSGNLSGGWLQHRKMYEENA